MLEIGCDLGAATRCLVAAGAVVLAVDKAADRLDRARNDVPGAAFSLCDVLRDPDGIEGEFEVVFIDINGSREYEAVATCVAWAERRWPDALVVVKSVTAMQRFWSGAINPTVPERQRGRVPGS